MMQCKSTFPISGAGPVVCRWPEQAHRAGRPRSQPEQAQAPQTPWCWPASQVAPFAGIPGALKPRSSRCKGRKFSIHPAKVWKWERKWRNSFDVCSTVTAARRKQCSRWQREACVIVIFTHVCRQATADYEEKSSCQDAGKAESYTQVKRYHAAWLGLYYCI